MLSRLSNIGGRALCKVKRSVRVPVPMHREFSASKEPEVTVDKSTGVKVEACGPTLTEDDPDELEEMFIEGPAGMEWNGPTRGGRRPEPTRFGDWERKGRASDF